MACQHREFQSQLDDTEKLRLYAQSTVSKHQALDTSLAKEKPRSKHWEREAKASAENIKLAEKGRDEAKQEAKVAYLVATTVGDAKARVEDDLASALDSLAVAEEDNHRSEAEITRLEVERSSLLLELEASKDKVSFLHSHADKDKEAMEEDY